MKKTISIALLFIVTGILNFSCQETEMQEPVSGEDIEFLESESEVKSMLDNIDDITYEAFLYSDNAGRIAEDDSSAIVCAQISVDRENKIVTIDFGDGCTDIFGNDKKGKIILTYTDWFFVPGAEHIMTFENFFINGIQIEGTRTLINISDDPENVFKYTADMNDGKITWPDGSVVTRQASWIHTRFRAKNINHDKKTLEGGASGLNRNGLEYTTEITKKLIWKRMCFAQGRANIPVEGIVTHTLAGEITLTIDYGDGSCDNNAIITQNNRVQNIKLRRYILG